MKITAIRIFPCRIKLKEPFIISLGPLYYAENVFVKIETDEGLTGFGECSPFRTINGESMETCYAVGKFYLSELLLNANPLDPENCSRLMDECIYGNSSIKSAFDMALFDIAAQAAGLPLYQFLGGSKTKDIFTDYTISISDPEKMAADAVRIKAEGYTVIKVKVGGSVDQDLERIRLIRQKIGNEIPLRIDANQGWDLETARTILAVLADYNIQHCEEPIARWKFLQLEELRKHSSIPIMADESCCDHNDAARLIQLHACDRMNVKLGKSSGIFKALKIIRLAEKENILLQVGGFLESRLGFTASAHLALCSDQIQFYDFDTPLMFEEDPVIGGITHKENGRIEVPDGIGLGAQIDEKYLKEYSLS